MGQMVGTPVSVSFIVVWGTVQIRVQGYRNRRPCYKIMLICNVIEEINE